MEIGNMKNILLLMGVAVAGAFWACGDGSIVTKSGDDEMALLNYGEFNPEGMKSLVNGALAACNEDPACVAAMEAAAKAEESSSSADSTAANSSGGSSSGTAGSSGSNGSSSSGGVNPGSSGAGGSSSGTAGSSGSVGSSSSAMLVSSSSLTPATNVAGVCAAAVNPFTGLGKNTPTTWSFTNTTTATAETYDWTFDEGASIAISTDATPSVSYSTAGTHVAKVIVNKGKSSESIETTCTSIVVTGTRASGCECTTNTTSPISVSAGSPQEVTWTVSGCTADGFSSFTYTWETGVTANGTSATKSISTGGTHAPKVTVTAEADTVVTCQAVTAEAPPTATCNIGKGQWGEASSTTYSTIPGGTFYFRPRNAEGFSGTKSMTVSYGSMSSPITVSAGDGNAGSAMTAPSQEGTYPVTLSYNGTELCSATLTVAYPKITTSCSLNKSTGGFSLGSFSGWDPNAIGQNISVTMYRNSDVVAENLSINAYYNSNPWKTVTLPKTVGNYTYRLDYQGNTVCSVPYNVSLQKPACYVGGTTSVGSSSSYTAIPGQTFYFKPGNSNIPSAKDMSLTFNGGTQSINVKPSDNSSTALQAPTGFGNYPIALSDNGESMCTATLTVDYPRPACNIGNSSSPSSTTYTAIPGETFYFKPGNSSFVGEIGMTYTFNGSTEDITLLPSNNEAIPLNAPTDLGTYPVTLKYGANQACSATLTVDYPKPSCNIGKNNNPSGTSVTAIPGKTVYFKPGNTSFTGQINMTYTFNGVTNDIIIKPTNSAISLTVPEPGTYPVKLSYRDNEVCTATLKAEYPAITAPNCAIGKNVYSSGKDYFTPKASFSNWTDEVGNSVTMTLYMDETPIGSASVSRWSNSEQWMQVTLPTDGEQHAFVLKYGNRTVCTVNYTN